MKDIFSKVLVLGLWLAAVCLALSSTWAGTFTWNGNGSDAFWTDNANWVGGVAPNTSNGTTDDVIFGDPASAQLNVDLNGGSINANNVTFNNNLSFNIGTGTFGSLSILGNLTQNANVTSTVIDNMLLFPSIGTTFNISGSRLTFGAGVTITDGGLNTITKTGSGTLVMNGIANNGNDFTGVSMIINAGTVLANNTSWSLGDSGVVVNGGTLGGMGTVVIGSSTFGGGNSTITVNAGTLAPGDPIVNGGVGTLTTFSSAQGASLVLSASSTLSFQLGAIGTGTTSDFIDDTNGDLTSAGTLQVTTLAGFGSGTYHLIHYGGVLVDDGMSLDPASYAAMAGLGYNAFISVDTTGQNVDLVVQTAPEPSTWVLLGCGLVAAYLQMVWMSCNRYRFKS